MKKQINACFFKINKPFKPWTRKQLVDFVVLILRYLFWYGITEWLLHYFYVSALSANPTLVAKMDLWTLAGLVFCFGQFFCLKYVFYYGISRPFVIADGIEPPNHPKCIARIHLYSDMWRYFDEGLYKFIRKWVIVNIYRKFFESIASRYIYIPIVSYRKSKTLLNQILASGLCFLFVYIWHGINPEIMVWSSLNYIGIILETIGRSLSQSKTFHELEVKNHNKILKMFDQDFWFSGKILLTKGVKIPPWSAVVPCPPLVHYQQHVLASGSRKWVDFHGEGVEFLAPWYPYDFALHFLRSSNRYWNQELGNPARTVKVGKIYLKRVNNI